MRTVDFRPNNLPTQATSFIGREHELEQAAQLLNNSRLLTFTGPSGTGKSRLALQVAVEQLDEFIDGVFYVPMSTVADPLLVGQTISANLDLKVGHRQNTAEVLKEHLRLKQILLLLDNFEHVIGAAPLIGALLNETPFLKIVITSREPLHIYGEQEFLVPTLGLPSDSKERDIDYLTNTEAVRLFIDRARAVNFEFNLTPEIAPDVAEICRRLDGLPLAIELAAARTKLFPPAILLKRLQHTLGELTGGPRDAPSHHQTLRNAIAWSYDWLSEEEQHLFRQLAVFRGGFTLEAAESICLLATASPTIDLVESLLNKNMLRQSEGYAVEPRFSMLRTIHEYAREQLAASGNEDEMRRRHLAYLLAKAEEANPHLLTGEKTSYWHGHLAQELDNFRAALAWALGADGQKPADPENGALLIGWIHPFLYVRGFLDEAGAGSACHSQRTRPSMARARALVGAGSLAWQQGDYTEARPFLEEAVAAFRELDDRRGLAEATHWLGHLTFDQKRYWAARKQFTESLALYEELGDEDNAVILSKDIGLVAYHEGDYLAARLRFEEVLEFYKRRLNIGGGVDALVHLGDLARLEDDLDSAEDNYRQAQQLFRENELSLGLAGSYHKLGQVAIRRGDCDLANSLLIKGLVMQQEAGNKQGIAESLAAFAGLALASRCGSIRAAVRDCGRLY